MALAERMNMFWDALRDDSARGARARRRVAALTGLSMFLLVLFAAVGLLRIVLLIGAVGVCSTGVLAAVPLARRQRSRRKHGAGGFFRRAVGAAARTAAGAP